MGSILMPFLVLAIFVGIFAEQNALNSGMAITQSQTQTLNDGDAFLNYRNALQAYLEANPSITGAITSAQLASKGWQFSNTFLAKVGNAVTTTGTNGRTLTVYGNLSSGVMSRILSLTNNDASFGFANSGNWTSSAVGVNTGSTTLATAVPNGYLVSVTQIGM